jgi:hypothetical protein
MGNGAFDPKEAKMMKSLTTAAILTLALTGPALAQSDLNKHFFDKWDLDADGAVTIAEVTEHRGDVFTAFDANDDGMLDADEYVVFDEARAENQAAFGKNFGSMKKDGTFGMTLRFNDLDKDGAVSRDEFVSRSADWVALMDRSTDGVITTADFRRDEN